MRHDKTKSKEIKVIADVAGVPVNAETAERIGNSIGPAFRRLCVDLRHAAVRSRTRELCSGANGGCSK